MPIPTIQGIAGVTADPEARHTGSGKMVLGIRLAFNDSKYNEQTSTWETSKTFYVDASAWEDTGVRLAETIRKGDQVYVEGRIETQQWEQDGQKRSKPNLTIRSMRKLEKGGKAQGQSQQSASQPAQPQQQWGGQQDAWGGGQQAAGHWDTPGQTEPPF